MTLQQKICLCSNWWLIVMSEVSLVLSTG